MRNGNFGVSVINGLLFDSNYSFLFLSNKQFLNFQSCFFFFPEVNYWVSLESFYKLQFGESALWTMIEVDLQLVSLRPLSVEVSTSSVVLASRVKSLEYIRMLIIMKVADKSTVFNNS